MATRHVDATSAGARAAIEQMLDLALANGARIHPALEVRERGGEISIHAEANEGETLIWLPEHLLVSVDGTVWDASAGELSIVEHDSSATAVQRDLVQSHLDVYNATDKIRWARATLPSLALYDDPLALRAVRLLRPRFAWEPQAVADRFIRTRVFHDHRPATGDGPEPPAGRRLYLLPIIDLLNHHAEGAPLRIRDGGMSIPVVHCAKDRQCFASYGPRSPLDLALAYGFVDREAAVARSLPLSVGVQGLGTVEVVGVHQLGPEAPTVALAPGRVELSHVTFSTQDPDSLRTTLELAVAAYLHWHGDPALQPAKVARELADLLVGTNLDRLGAARAELDGAESAAARLVAESIDAQRAVIRDAMDVKSDSQRSPSRDRTARPARSNRLSPMTSSWLRAWEPLTGSVQTIVDDELGPRFERSRETAVHSARARLNARLPFPTDALTTAEPQLREGTLSGPPLLGGDWLDTIERALQLGGRPGRPAARMVHTEAFGVLDPGTENESPRLDPCRPARVIAGLDDGWMLEIPSLAGVDPALARFVADLETVCDTTAEPIGWYGIRSALGPPLRRGPHRRLVIQLVGRREVLVSKPDGEQDQFHVRPGTVLLVPPERAIHHLPLDLDTLHIEIPLPAPMDEQPAQAMRQAAQPARVADRLTTARAALATDPDPGHPYRWAAPGGVHVIKCPSAPDLPVELAAGGRRLLVERRGIDALEEVASGEWRRASDLVEPGEDCEQASAFLEGLWLAGLVEAGEAPRQVAVAERLTRVGHADVLSGEQCALIVSEARSWRSPEAWELRVAAGDGGRIDVCTLPPGLDGLATVRQAVSLVNQQIFRFSLTGLDPDDPLLLVRHRAARERGSPALDDYHPDVDEQVPGRKLTFAVPLDRADSDAGRVRLAGGSDTMGASPGQVSVFASFRSWVLEPLDSGVRHTLIGRLHGPQFC